MSKLRIYIGGFSQREFLENTLREATCAFSDAFIPPDAEKLHPDIIVLSEEEAIIFDEVDKGCLTYISKRMCPILILKPGFGNAFLKGSCCLQQRNSSVILSTAKRNSIKDKKIDLMSILSRLLTNEEVFKKLSKKLIAEIQRLSASNNQRMKFNLTRETLEMVLDRK